MSLHDPITAAPSFTYLSAEQIEGLPISESAIMDAVETIFKQYGLGRTLQKPKANLAPKPGYVVEALAGVDIDLNRAAVKWVSVSPGNRDRGLPNVQAMIILSETKTGTPLAVMDGTWITGIRTAACTAVAAKYLASKQSTSLSFIGAGYQARTHLKLLRSLFPSLEKVTVYAGASPTAGQFTEFVRNQGLEAVHVHDPRQAVEGHDIVVSTIPPATVTRFLDPAWVSPGTFVSAIDLGRPWLDTNWSKVFDITATDDQQQSEEWGRVGKMLIPERFDAEISDLALQRHAGRTDSTQRTALLFAGMGLTDLAVASLVFDIAIKNTTGLSHSI